MRIAPKAILHIGAEKTGTTSLQKFLSSRRSELSDSGYHYPIFPGNVNHFKLAAYAQDDNTFDDLRLFAGIRNLSDVKAFRKKFEFEAFAELSKFRGRNLIFSSEHCQSRLRSKPEVLRLKDFLYQFVEEVDICVYLRRQDRLAVSRFSSVVKFGGGGDVLEQEDIEPSYWDFQRLLKLWSDAFGKKAIRVEVAEKACLSGESVVSDFLNAYGIPIDGSSYRRENLSLTPEALLTLKQINTLIPLEKDGEINLERGNLVECLESNFPGEGLKPSKARAKKFLLTFNPINEAVRQEWFPSREKLFDNNFDDYPDFEMVKTNTESTINIFATLWRAVQLERNEMLNEIKVRDNEIGELRRQLMELDEFLPRVCRKSKKLALSLMRSFCRWVYRFK